MAKLKGLEIKKVVEFKGHEGEHLFQCDVYYKGKKVGFFSQDSWGGPEIVEVPASVRKVFEDYAYVGKNGETHPTMKGIEWAIYDLSELRDVEKTYKTYLKKGYDTTIIVDVNEWQYTSLGMRALGATTETIIKKIKERYNDFANLPDKAFRIYKGTEFVIE